MRAPLRLPADGDRWRAHALRRPAAWLVGLGLAVVGMLVAVERIAERHVVGYAPALAAASRLGVAVASSHVWLEEHIAGDRGVDVAADVLAPMAEAEALIAALASGGPSAVDGADRAQRIEPLDEPALRRRVGRIEALHERFRTLAVTRIDQGPAAGAGSPLDRRYDAVFRTLLTEVRELEASIARRLDAGRRRSRLLFAAILCAWAALVGGALVALAHRERRRRRTEATLAEREAQLGQAQKLEAVGRLAGGLAHDVNNYLAAINAQCGLIRLKRAGDADLGAMLDEIGETVRRISNLLVRLLAFSRNRPLAPRVVDLNELAQEMGGMMRRLLGDDVTLALALEDDLWPVEIDPVEVEQVLVNLLVNAREAMPRGGRVTLATANHRGGRRDGAPLPAGGTGAAAGDWVVLSVADTGEGITDEVRERIFEPFFSTKGRSGHSGLGLATVYGVARRAGGFVRLESASGAGARFEVHLPRTTRASAAAEPAERTAPPAPPFRARLLLVDDNAALAAAIAAYLSQAGHRVTRVGDGRAALGRLAADDGFDAVVTDLVLPRASGRDVAERALALGLPVVMVSAFPDRVEIADLLREPRVRFLDKPFEPEALLAALGEVLAGRRAQRAPIAAV